jgi:catechol 2,3-dioxygenase-like lactoylglutathione lyase family enzyme
MQQALIHVSLLVKDYDEAIAFYTQKLGFELIENTPLSTTKRWVLVAPKGSKNAALLLAKAANEEQSQYIGNQSGGRVFLFLSTDNFQRDYEAYLAHGVEFVRPPSQESYGIVAVFRDLYGNLWDLIEKKQ